MNELLLTNLHILTFDSNFNEITEGSILIENNIIKYIGSGKKLIPSSQTKIIDCSGKVAMPGLINSHTHLPMSIFKGLGHNTSEIIYNLMFPVEKNLKASDIEILSLSGGAEALRSGCTTVVEHYYFADEIASALKKLGLRAFIGHTTMDLSGPHIGEKEFKASYDFIDKWKNDDLITPTLAPHATDTVSKEKLTHLLEISNDKDLLLHLHIAQTLKEVKTIKNKYNKTPVQFLDSIGFLSKKVLAAHLIHVNERDMDILAEKNVNYLCSPVSQLFFEKLAPIEKMLEKKINFSLATDCVASNDGMNLFHEGRALNLALIERVKNPLKLSSKEILSMATLNSARALNCEDKLGSLEMGKLADILILDLNKPRTSPLHNIYNTLLYSFSERDIEMVIVNGSIIIEKGDFVNFDEKKSAFDLTKKAQSIFKRMK